jgi:GNAT superfamily N-acetyltransferase
MPALTAIAEIRTRLETDRPWALYALGDLTPEHEAVSRWLGADDGALALLYTAFTTPVFFALGGAASIRALLAELDAPELFALVKPEIAPVLAERYTLQPSFAMWRMILDPKRASSSVCNSVSRLTPEDMPALLRLYADDEREEGDPRFFTPAMLEQGIYYGIREGEELTAAAGTHLVAPSEGVGAIGNVYTRRDRRGRGLASLTVGAVVAHLQRLELRTIGLNVSQTNAVAIRLYERLGFVRACPYVEAHAVRRTEQAK